MPGQVRADSGEAGAATCWVDALIAAAVLGAPMPADARALTVLTRASLGFSPPEEAVRGHAL